METIVCRLKIRDEIGICPSGHSTRYKILIPRRGEVCAMCLAIGNCDEWFGIKK